jgi:hypothetical protein
MLELVKAKTEEFLNLFLWSAEQLTRPTFRNLTDSYEAWAYRNGLLRQIHRLERKRWIEGRSGARSDRLYRLTAQGRLIVLGGRDPEQRWGRHWDGQWRIVLFDVPLRKNAQRRRPHPEKAVLVGAEVYGTHQHQPNSCARNFGFAR